MLEGSSPPPTRLWSIQGGIPCCALALDSADFLLSFYWPGRERPWETAEAHTFGHLCSHIHLLWRTCGGSLELTACLKSGFYPDCLSPPPHCIIHFLILSCHVSSILLFFSYHHQPFPQRYYTVLNNTLYDWNYNIHVYILFSSLQHHPDPTSELFLIISESSNRATI